MTKPITHVTTELYELLEPLPSEDRQRALVAVLTLLGEKLEVQNQRATPAVFSERVLPEDNSCADFGGDIGNNAAKWMIQYQLKREYLDQIFHISKGETEIIISDVPGRSRREKTACCYLLTGVKNLLANDEAQFTEKEALEVCHATDAYDKNNHTMNRASLDNRVSGDRKSGFRLTVPGLRDAAKLIKEITAKEF